MLRALVFFAAFLVAAPAFANASSNCGGSTFSRPNLGPALYATCTLSSLNEEGWIDVAPSAVVTITQKGSTTSSYGISAWDCPGDATDSTDADCVRVPFIVGGSAVFEWTAEDATPANQWAEGLAGLRRLVLRASTHPSGTNTLTLRVTRR